MDQPGSGIIRRFCSVVSGRRSVELVAMGAVVVAMVPGATQPTVAAAQADGCPNADLRVGASSGLSDCRAFELVSPPDKVGGQGAGIWYRGPVSAGHGGVAALEGDRFAVQSQWGSVLVDGAFSFANDWALTERDPAAGWRRRPMMTRTAYGTQEYRFVQMGAATGDLSLTGWVPNTGVLKLFPEMAGWDQVANLITAFVRDWEGRWDLFGPTLVTPGQEAPNNSSPLSPLAASADGRFMVGSGATRGLEGPGDPTLAPGALATGTGSVYLFDLEAGVSDQFPTSADGRRILVNECTAGTTVPSLTATSPAKLDAQACAAGTLVSPRGATLGRNRPITANWRDVDRAVSADGSRVFFMSPNPFSVSGGPTPPGTCSGTGASTLCPSQVFVRQRAVDGSVAVRWVSRPAVANQNANLMSRVFYEGASADGSRVFFRTTAPLTGDDPNSGCVARQGVPLPCVTDPSGAQNVSSDLFMYELPDGPDGDPATPDGDPGGGTLRRISAGPTGAGDCDVMLNGNSAQNSQIPPASLRYASDDGSRVYFTCQSPLAGVAGAPANSHGDNVPGSGDDFTNLYLYERSAGGESWRFVARLPRDVGSPGQASAAACASTASGKGTPLNINAGLGPATGMRPQNCFRGTRDGSFVTFWTSGQLTAESPVPDPDTTSIDIYAYDAASDQLSRVTAPDVDAVGGTYVCNPGDPSTPPSPCFGDGGFGGDGMQALTRLGIVEDPGAPGSRIALFQSRSRLIAADTDDAYDVYEWRDGELSLFTPGDGQTDDVMFLGNDRAGDNVYVATLARLSWEDRDSALDVYSARVDGGFAEPVSPVVCSLVSDGCQGGGPGAVGGPVVVSDGVGGGESSRAARVRLSVGGLSVAARRRAARSGVLRLRVRTNTAGVVRVGARARIGRGSVKVAGARKRMTRTGARIVRLRLNGRARGVLRQGRVLRVTVRVAQAGARTRTATVRLERGDR